MKKHIQLTSMMLQRAGAEVWLSTNLQMTNMIHRHHTCLAAADTPACSCQTFRDADVGIFWNCCHLPLLFAYLNI
jgi:hypothetical protein